MSAKVIKLKQNQSGQAYFDIKFKTIKQKISINRQKPLF